MSNLKLHLSVLGTLRLKQVVSMLLLTLCIVAIGCGPDCEVSTYKKVRCVNEGSAGNAQQELDRIDCETGEQPTYYSCWEEVDTTNCIDAQRICAQYAGD